MSTERLDIVIREDGSRVVKRNIADIGREATGAARGVQLLQRAMLGLGAGAALIFLQRQADAYTNIQNRLRLVTRGTADLANVTGELFDMSNRTRSSFEATAELYAALARSSKELGVSQKDLMTVTESVNMAVQISGTEAATAAQGIRQLGQALASGVLRGDEFNSIMENMPRVALAIADSLGVGVGKLRAMAAEGELTARQIIVALRAAAPQLKAEFEKITPTIAGSFTVLHNNITKFIGEANAASGASALVSQSIILLANNLDKVVTVLMSAVAAWAIWRGALAVQALFQYVQGLMAIQMALGATATQAFATGVAMRGLQAAMAWLSVFAIPLAIGAGLVYLANNAAQASAVLRDLEQSGQTAAIQLLEMEAKARGAGMQVDSLTSAAGLANPIIAGIARQYGVAADQAQRLANNARAAAIAVAQGKITELKAKQDSLRPAYGGPGAGHVAAIQGALGAMGFGPTLKERADGIKQAQAEIGIYEQQIKLLKEAPKEFFNPDPITGGNVPGKDKKDKKGGGQTRAEFLAEVNRETQNSIGLTSILDANWRRVQEQIVGIGEHLAANKWAPLTDAENASLTSQLQLLQEQGELMRVRDAIASHFTDALKDQARVEVAAKQLLDQSIITVAQYTRAIEDARLAVLDLNEDGASGLERGLIRIQQLVRDEASRMERALVGIYQDIKGPMMAFEAGQKAINELVAKGKFNADEAARAFRDLRIEYLQTQTDLASGLELGKLQTQRDTDDVGSRVARAYQDEFQSVNGELQELHARQAALKQLMVDDPINSGRYAQQLGIVAAQLRAVAPGADVFDQARAALADFVADYRGILPGLRQAFGQTFQQIGDGIANALSRAIVYGESLSAALKDVARSALQELIAALIKLGIQWLVMQVIGQTMAATVSATAAAGGPMVAAAWAPAAAMVSLATFGANAGPAMTGIALTAALTSALATAGGALGGGFRDGGYTGNGGEGEVAGVVHGREFVMNADATRKHRGLLELLNEGKSPMGYRTGGYVRPRLGSSSSLGSSGRIEGAQAPVGGDTISVSIDARGAEAGVEEKIEEALEAALPVFLARSRRQESEVQENAARRQSLGGIRGRR